MGYFQDKLVNLVANLGTGRDKAAGSAYAFIPTPKDQLLASYRGSWLPRKIVDIPAKDATRRWRSWQASKEQITRIEAEERRLDLQGKVLKAKRQARLLGGAAIYIGTKDRDASQPLDPNRIAQGGISYLTVLSKDRCSAGEIENDPIQENYGKPKYYTIGQAQTRVHPSRLMIFIGADIPDDDLTGVDQGWGDSVLDSIITEIRNSDGTMANIASLVFEAKVDVIHIPDLMQVVGRKEDEEKLLQRFRLAMTAKGTNGVILLDGGDGAGNGKEEYDTKSVSFANLPEIADRFMQIVSGAADIPATRLLGQSPAGLNSTGEADLRNYYDRIQSEQNLELTPAMALFDECLIRSALGSRPTEIFYNWNPLWQMSQTEIIANGKVLADTINVLNTTQLFNAEALSMAATNALVESGVLPGLENAIEQVGSASPNENDEAEPPDTE